MKNILLVQDETVKEKLITNFLRKIFGEKKINIVVAKNGLEGIEKFKENSFDFVIMDYHMPVMEGPASIRGIREVSGTVPIVGWTDVINKEPKKAQEMMDAGLNDFLPNPGTRETIGSALQKFGLLA